MICKRTSNITQTQNFTKNDDVDKLSQYVPINK